MNRATAKQLAEDIDILQFYDDGGSDAFNYDRYREAILDAIFQVPDWVGKPDENGDIHCSRLAPKRCMWLEGHYGGCATP